LSKKPSYQTAPLTSYSKQHQDFAERLYNDLAPRIGLRLSKKYKGSYSFLSKEAGPTAAKIIIYEDGKGKTNGDWPIYRDGVYLLLRCGGNEKSTIGVAPKHAERFRFIPVAPERMEEAAKYVAKRATSLTN
jgi:hypothetical protein